MVGNKPDYPVLHTLKIIIGLRNTDNETADADGVDASNGIR